MLHTASPFVTLSATGATCEGRKKGKHKDTCRRNRVRHGADQIDVMSNTCSLCVYIVLQQMPKTKGRRHQMRIKSALIVPPPPICIQRLSHKCRPLHSAALSSACATVNAPHHERIQRPHHPPASFIHALSSSSVATTSTFPANCPYIPQRPAWRFQSTAGSYQVRRKYERECNCRDFGW